MPVKPRSHLSDIAASRLRPQDADYMVRAGPNLFLRVRVSGAKTLVYRYSQGGRTRELKIGDYADPGAVRDVAEGVVLVSLAEGRRRASEMHAQRRDPLRPVDPSAAKARRQAAAMTIDDLADEFQARVIEREHRRPAWNRWVYATYLKGQLGKVAVRDVDRGMVHKALDPVVLRGASVAANRALLNLKKLLAYAVKRQYIERNPLAEMQRADVGGREAPRDRVVSFAELRALWRDTAERSPPTLAWQTRLVIRLLMLTGSRVGETLLAEWSHVDTDAGVWSIPKENTKAGRSHVVFLGDEAKAVLAEARALSGTRRYIFQADGDRDEPVRRHSINRALARLQARPVKDKPAKHELSAIPQSEGAFTTHDLRRAFASHVGEFTAPHVVERMLNHAPQGLAAIYNRALLAEQCEEAWHEWGRRLRALVHAENVTAISKRKRA